MAERKANKMSGQIEPVRTKRSARTPGDSAATKAEHLRGTLSGALKKLSKEPLAPARTSAALLALRPRANEIREALARGWSANAIAEIIADEAADGTMFSTETLRNAIKRLADEVRTSARTTATAVKNTPVPSTAVTPIRTASSTTSHAGFAEDPT
jgi:hypothetical protein